MLFEVRQGVTLQLHQRHGLAIGPGVGARRMLPAAGNWLPRGQRERLSRVLAIDDSTGEIGAAWVCKVLLGQHEPHRIRAVLWRFMHETTRVGDHHRDVVLAILVALNERVTNVRTDGLN